MVKRFLNFIWEEAYRKNDENILSMLDRNIKAKVLDIGCGDGHKTIKFKEKISCRKMVGLDGVQERLKVAKKIGVDDVVKSDLEKGWPFKNRSFDIIISNQVIEHILDIDHFISEIYRILKPKGYCVISTENLSSWHNIFALTLGHQDFSHHIIKKLHVANPLSPHYGERTVAWSGPGNSGIDDTAFPHIKILTFKSLIGVFKAYKFKYIKGKGSGYYPLFGVVSSFASRLDPFHSHFITAKFIKS